MGQGMVIRAASDVGGTFTDLVFYDVDAAMGRCGVVRTAKVDTTPPQFQKGVMNSLKKSGITPAQLGFFAHGATVVINAIMERKGARVGLIDPEAFPAGGSNGGRDLLPTRLFEHEQRSTHSQRGAQSVAGGIRRGFA